MRIAVAADHAGLSIKKIVREVPEASGHEVLDSFIGARFSNEERHCRRLEKVRALEEVLCQ